MPSGTLWRVSFHWGSSLQELLKLRYSVRYSDRVEGERWNISLQGMPARSWNPTILVWNWHYWYGIHTFGLIINEVSCTNPIPKKAQCWKTHNAACKSLTIRFRRFWYGIGITGMGFIQLDLLFTTLRVPIPYPNRSFRSRTLVLTQSRHDLVWNWHTKYGK